MRPSLCTHANIRSRSLYFVVAARIPRCVTRTEGLSLGYFLLFARLLEKQILHLDKKSIQPKRIQRDCKFKVAFLIVAADCATYIYICAWWMQPYCQYASVCVELSTIPYTYTFLHIHARTIVHIWSLNSTQSQAAGSVALNMNSYKFIKGCVRGGGGKYLSHIYICYVLPHIAYVRWNGFV